MPRPPNASSDDTTKARAFCFCWNNPERTPEEFNEWIRNIPNIRYYVFQHESGEETNTPHYQGYAYFSTKKRLCAMRRRFLGSGVLIANGTAEHNKAYCTKVETRIGGPWEWGDMPRQGRRTDWEKLRKDATEQNEEYLFIHHFPLMIRHLSSIQYFQKRTQRPPMRTASIIALIGPSGTRKSSYVADTWPNAYWQPPGEWYPGYSGEPTVVLDDFYGHIPLHELLRMADRFPLYLRCKNGNLPCHLENLVITSNRGPFHWYRNWRTAPFDSLLRRMSKIMSFTSAGTWDEYNGDTTAESIPEKKLWLETHGWAIAE